MTNKTRRLQIQNALRLLTSLVPKGASLHFDGGDLVTLVYSQVQGPDHTPYAMLRTQDAAQILDELNPNPED